MSAPKLYLNEHISPDVARAIRARGYDCISTQEAGLLGVPDDEQMSFAVRDDRVLVTFNIEDFQALHANYTEGNRSHPGILISTEVQIPTLIQRLFNFLRSMTAEEMRNQIRWLNDFR